MSVLPLRAVRALNPTLNPGPYTRFSFFIFHFSFYLYRMNLKLHKKMLLYYLQKKKTIVVGFGRDVRQERKKCVNR